MTAILDMVTIVAPYVAVISAILIVLAELARENLVEYLD